MRGTGKVLAAIAGAVAITLVASWRELRRPAGSEERDRVEDRVLRRAQRRVRGLRRAAPERHEVRGQGDQRQGRPGRLHDQDRLEGQQGRPDPDRDDDPGAARPGHQDLRHHDGRHGGRGRSARGAGRRDRERRRQHRAGDRQEHRQARVHDRVRRQRAGLGRSPVRLQDGLPQGLRDRLARDPVHEVHPALLRGRVQARLRRQGHEQGHLQDRLDRLQHAGHEDPERQARSPT